MSTSAFIQDQPEQLEQDTILSHISVEMMLYLLLFVVGACARFLWLDYSPLASDEAQQALASWNFVRGSADGFTGSPLLFTGNAILFALFGATDFAARFIPAVAGSVLVLLPALLRREIGRIGALIAAAFFALSPSLVFFSRNANGTIVAVTLALAALIFAWRFATDHSPRGLNMAAVLGILALVSAREVWTIFLSLIVLLFVMRPRYEFRIQKGVWRSAALLTSVAFLGVTTTLMFHREGVGAAFDLFGAWLGGLRPSIAFSDPLRLLVVYEPIILILGVAALLRIVLAFARKEEIDTPRLAFALWASIGFILYTIGADKNPARVIVIIVPLTLLAAQWLDAWLNRVRLETDRETFLSQDLPVFMLACAIAAFLFLVFAEFATRGNIAAAQVIAAATKLPENSGLVVFVLAILGSATITFLTIATVGVSRAADVGLAILLAWLTLWTIRQSAIANFGALNPQELLVARAPSLNIRDLENDLQDISRWRANDSHTLTVAVDESLSPILGWTLRDFRNARFVARTTPTNDVQAVLSPTSAPMPATGWISQTYTLENSRGGSNSDLIRWLIFRDTGATESTRVTLWIPAPR